LGGWRWGWGDEGWGEWESVSVGLVGRVVHTQAETEAVAVKRRRIAESCIVIIWEGWMMNLFVILGSGWGRTRRCAVEEALLINLERKPY